MYQSYELEPEPEPEPGPGYQPYQQPYGSQPQQMDAPQVSIQTLRPGAAPPAPSARAVSRAAEVRIETELDHVRGQIAQLEEEGRTALEHVSRLEQEVTHAQTELSRAREFKQGLAQQVEESEQMSLSAYHTNTEVIAQNTAMQKELQQLQAQIAAVQAEAASEHKLRLEQEVTLKQEQEGIAGVLDTLSDLKRESAELDDLIAQAEVEIQHEQGVTQQLMADLDYARMGGQGPQHQGGDSSIEATMARQVQNLQAENDELIKELARWQRNAAKQKDIHAAVGEMSSIPMQLASANTQMAAELSRLNATNAQRRRLVGATSGGGAAGGVANGAGGLDTGGQGAVGDAGLYGQSQQQPQQQWHQQHQQPQQPPQQQWQQPPPQQQWQQQQQQQRWQQQPPPQQQQRWQPDDTESYL